MKKVVDNRVSLYYNFTCVTDEAEINSINSLGVWLSLARVPGLGPGGRRFESCHPDFMRV